MRYQLAFTVAVFNEDNTRASLYEKQITCFVEASSIEEACRILGKRLSDPDVPNESEPHDP